MGDRAIPFDVTASVRLPRVRKPEGADGDGLIIPEATEVGALLRGAEDEFAAFIGLCAFGGLRLGEAAALKVSDVDFIRQEIHVDRQVQRSKGKQVEIGSPRYGSSQAKANTRCIRTRLATGGAWPRQRLASTTGCTT